MADNISAHVWYNAVCISIYFIGIKMHSSTGFSIKLFEYKTALVNRMTQNGNDINPDNLTQRNTTSNLKLENSIHTKRANSY